MPYVSIYINYIWILPVILSIKQRKLLAKCLEIIPKGIKDTFSKVDILVVQQILNGVINFKYVLPGQTLFDKFYYLWDN